MKYVIACLLLVLSLTNRVSYAQGVIVNFDLDTTVWPVGEPLRLWQDFLATKNDSVGAQYWNSEEIERYGHKDYFAVKKELNYNYPDFLTLMSYGNVRVLSIRERGDYYKITNQFSFVNEQDSVRVEDIHCIFHVYAGKENGELKLFNALKVNSAQELNQQKIGFITYYYPKRHQLDLEKARQQNDFMIELAEAFDVPVTEVNYYFADYNETLQRIKGFDFLVGDNGKPMPSGKAYVKDKNVFTCGAGEYYPHEIIHVLLNPHYPNAHLWINEGVATYFGMSRGKELKWHLEKLNTYLHEHPEVDLGDMLSLRTLDAETDFRYVLGGYIIQRILEKEGYEGIKKAMNAGKTNADFYQVIEDQLGIAQADINVQFREDIYALFEKKD